VMEAGVGHRRQGARHVSVGSRTALIRYSLDVRFTSNSDQTADIPEGPFRARSRHSKRRDVKTLDWQFCNPCRAGPDHDCTTGYLPFL
jgi:hypothetical protein